MHALIAYSEQQTVNRGVQRHPGDAKCVTEILGDKNKEVAGGGKV